MTQARRALGASGEEAVAAWYVQHGYEIIARNWRCRAGELDLIVRRGRTFVFCEVKAPTVHDHQATRWASAAWLEDHPEPAREVRFDVAEVAGDGTVTVAEGAF